MRPPDRTAVVLRCARQDPQEHRRDERRVAGEDQSSAGSRVPERGDDAREGVAGLVGLGDDLDSELR